MQAVNDPLGLGEGPLLALTVKYLYIKSINHPQEWTTTNGETGYTYKTEYFHTRYSTNLRTFLVYGEKLLYTPKMFCPLARICLASVRMKMSALNASSRHKPRRNKQKKIEQSHLYDIAVARFKPENTRNKSDRLIPSLRMPIFMHFFKRQYWHWFLWCWSMGQFLLPLHEYERFLRTLLLKKDLQPVKSNKKYIIVI